MGLYLEWAVSRRRPCIYKEPVCGLYNLPMLRTSLIAIMLLLPAAVHGETPATSPPHDAITAGCQEVGGGFLISRVELDNADLEPLLWGTPRATGGDKLGLQGTLPTVAAAGYSGHGRVAVWTAHEGFWGEGPDGSADNDRFRENMLGWLLGGGKRVGLSTGHGEMLNTEKLSPALRDWMNIEGISCADVPGTLSAQSLADFDLLIVGNTWGEFPEGEVDAAADWVNQGGALLAIGLGWAYYQYNDDPDGGNYAINRLGARFGWKALDGTITDPRAPNGDSGKPSFAVKPLSEYKPGKVLVMREGVDDLSAIPRLAAEKPGDIYVAVGEYMGLQFPSDAWAGVANPAAAVDLMDQVYAVEEDLIGWTNRPYGGANIWYVSVDDPDGKYYMHSGNPIVMKLGAGRDTAKTINEKGMCGWGPAHELGHDMVISACGNLFVHSGTGEEWCNVFSTWTLKKMGWPEREGSFDEGHKYNAEEHPDFEHMKSNPWVLLGCLELIWDKYGWDGMQQFLTQAAEDTKNGMRNKGDKERTAYWVENMSRAYQLDLAPLITHWGFPVSDASRKITSQYPEPDIDFPSA